MSQSVTIKSNKYGINLILDADMPFADLIKAVVEKFKVLSMSYHPMVTRS